MKTWLHLSAEGLTEPCAQWPCCVWRAAGDSKHMLLIEAAQDLAQQPVHLLLPMEMCSFLRTQPWPSKRRPSAQAIAFAIEDQLAEDLEGVHVSAGNRDREGRYPVLVTHKAQFKALMQLLATLSIQVSHVHVDADLLPEQTSAAVDWYGRRVVGGNLQLALCPKDLQTLEPLLTAPLDWLDETDSQAVIETALWSGQGRSINLLQGEFGQVRRAWPWATVILAIGVLLMVEFVSMRVRIHTFESQAQQLNEHSRQRFQTLYPQQTRIVDLSAQLDALQAQSAPPTTTALARLVRLTEQVIGGGDVDVQRIEYRAGEGWKLQLTAASFKALEQLRERGQVSGMPLRLGNASTHGSRVQAALMLEDSR